MRWQASSFFGWGVAGMNLFARWMADPDIQPLMGTPIVPRDLAGIDPLRYSVMKPPIAASNRFLQALRAGEVSLHEQGVVVIDSFGNELKWATDRTEELGIRNVARCIFEDTRIDTTRPIERYDGLLCASQWNASLLRAVTDKPVKMIHEGVDHSLFFPGPRSGILDPECFYVFTGGKIEFRKAQDLVIAAFREFAAHHDDAVLVAAWNSPWTDDSARFTANLSAPLRKGSNGLPEIQRWVVENGINPHQFIELEMSPNFLMPAILREMDCALQVSRCEGGTNLPAKEAMACGVPVILANNTGVRDLIDVDNCVPLRTQDPVIGETGVGTDGWGESRVEEIVEALEKLYTDTPMRKRIGARGAEWILEHRRTWGDHASDLKAYLLGML